MHGRDRHSGAGPRGLHTQARIASEAESRPSLCEDERTLIATGYERALIALRKNITPTGFSACSLADNTVTGTDVNYRSVWARDGCFPVVQTIEMDDPDIREAQLNTLRTLLNAIAPNGQVPANVRIDDRTPEYTGVGGICSIDSGLWLILAVYHPRIVATIFRAP